MLHDLRFALRALARMPGYTAVIVVTLALAIGATTTIFSVVRGVLLRPLPFADQDRLVTLWQRAPGVGVDEDWFSAAQYFDIREGAPSLEHVAVTWGEELTLTGEGIEPTRIGALRVSSSFFDVLGVGPVSGQRFTADDDAPGATRKVILGHSVFAQQFGGDGGIVGQSLVLNGQPVEVVGVMPPLTLDLDIMPTLLTVPRFEMFVNFPLEDPGATTRGSENYNIIAKLAADVPRSRLDAELLGVAEEFTRDPGALGANLTAGEDFSIGVVPLIDEVTGPVQAPLMLLLGATAVLLLIACANVANLLLTRAATRRRQLGIKAALGASRTRMLRQTLLESLALALAGGSGGVLIAMIGVRALHRAAPDSLPRLADIVVDPGVLGFAALTCVASSLLFGMAPALRNAGANPGTVLRENATAVGGRSMWRRGGSRLLVLAQVALSTLLVIGAGLLVRTFWELQSIDPGFAPDRALSFRVALPGERYREPDARVQFYELLFERLGGAPGVEAVGGTSLLPLTRGLAWTDYLVEGFNEDNPDDRIVADVMTVTPGYLEAMEIDIVAGRAFESLDGNEPPVVMVNRDFAERFWPAEDAVGKWIATNPERPMTIIGVAETVRHYGLNADTRPAVFYPHRGRPNRDLFGVVGAARGGDVTALSAAVTGAVRAIDDQVAVSNIDSMRGRFNASLAQQRVLMWLLNFFGLTALVLAAVGLYGVLSFAVATQTREIGIRKALGAQRHDLYILVLRGATLVIGAGALIGVLAANGTARLVDSSLFAVGTGDALTYTVAVTLVIVVGLLSGLFPARRAAGIEAIEALRQD